MGLFSSLFGKKEKKEEPKVVVSSSNSDVSMSVPTNPNSTVSDEIKNIVLLALSEKFKVGEKQYPGYMVNVYGIPFPNEGFAKLKEKGFIRETTAPETLSHLTLPELKEIATKYEVKTSGKKDALCQRMTEEIPVDELEKSVTVRFWKITDEGQTELTKYPYISFYLEKHKYSLDQLGLNLKELSQLFKGKENLRTRDIIWGEFNRRTTEYYAEAIKDAEFYGYNENLRAMALFLEEEERFLDGLASYARYLYYHVNFGASAKALRYYLILKDMNHSIDMFRMESELLPFMKDELLALSNECGYDSAKLSEFLRESFLKEKDEGLFTIDQLMDVVFLQLNGDNQSHKGICEEALKSGIKKMSGKK